MEDRSIIDDAQLWAAQSNVAWKSNQARAAGKALQEYHKDLPEIVGSSAKLLGNLDINVSESRTTTRRLLDSAVREIVGGGKEEYTAVERQEIMRNTLRDVLIQEAAGYEITRRGGVDPSRDHDRDPDRGQGESAIKTLRRQNVDIDGLLGHMTEHDLAKTSHGAYNKVSLLAHPHLMKALGASEQIMTESQESLNRSLNGSIERANAPAASQHHAIQPIRRFQAPAPKRLPSFGRRMSHVQALNAGVAM